MKTYLIGVLVVYVALQAFKDVLEYLNVRHARRRGPFVPQEFEGIVDRASLEKMLAYVKEKTAFEMVASTAATLATIIFLFGGLLDRYNSWVASFGLPLVLSGPAFFLLLYAAGALLWVPFTLYFVFRIENRHGFNTMTGRLWLADFVKSTALSLILLALLSLASFALISWSPRFWWLWVWCFILSFTIFITYAAPYVIEPLFNKFVPVEDDDLEARIVSLASQAGINVSKILKMDESKRSRHTNAYFAGIGRTKRIILFDTLLQGMTPDEIIAVLAHEIGHWKRRHLLKGLAISQALSLIVLFCSYHALKGSNPRCPLWHHHRYLACQDTPHRLLRVHVLVFPQAGNERLFPEAGEGSRPLLLRSCGQVRNHGGRPREALQGEPFQPLSASALCFFQLFPSAGP